MKKIKILIYYSVISKLPHSRYLKLFNTIRCFYIEKVLKVSMSGPKNYFENNVYIGNGSNITIGENCQINEDVFIQGAKIGNNVMIATNVSILCNSHIHSNINIPMIDQGVTEVSIPIIKDNVWIGRNVVVLPGIIIEEGVIVGAGAVVTKNIERYTIVGGVPAKFIKNRV